MSERISRRSLLKDSIRAGAVLGILALPINPLAASAAPTPPEKLTFEPNLNSKDLAIYYPKTGHHLSGKFLDFWRRHRNGELMGLPITEVLPTGKDKFTQYFENVVLEEKPTPSGLDQEVRLVNVGEEYTPEGFNYSKGPLTLQLPGLFWQKHGGHEFFGQPISPIIPEFLSNLPYELRLELGKNIPESDFTQYTKNFAFTSHVWVQPSPQFDGKGGTYDWYRNFKRNYKLKELVWPGEIEPIPLGRHAAKDMSTSTESVRPSHLAIIYSDNLWDKDKQITVNLATQRLVAKEDSVPILETFASTGKERYSTPTGRFKVIKKIEVMDYWSPLTEIDYHVSSVPNNLLFNPGEYYIHGAYWHQDFGKTHSYGCVNLNLDDAAWVYDWAKDGTPIIVT